MSGIELNKIAAAILLAGLIAMIAGVATEALYSEGESDRRGYKVEGAETAESAAAPVAAEKPVDILPLIARADPAQGAQLIGRCMACHSFEKGKPNGVGPNQYGLVGRKVASVEGFNYSDAMKAKGGSWGFQELSDFLASPQKAVPGTRMAFAGIKKPEERAALIAYINKTFSDQALPLPPSK
jgi:cytochrome c